LFAPPTIQFWLISMKPSAISRCVHDSHDHRFCAAVVHRPYGTAVLHPYAHPYAVWRSGLPLECRFRSAAVLLEATLVRALSAEAVRKHGDFLRLAEQSEILRDFLASERSEGSKKRTK
jgi:hypothetical protein